MRITYIHNGSAGHCESVEWRCHSLAQAINRNSRHQASEILLEDFLEATPEAREICECSDILILHRVLWGKVLTAVQHWMARGKVVIVDFEEAVQLLDQGDADYAFWHSREEVSSLHGKMIHSPILEQFKWGMQMVNAATVPSKRLADDWKAYNRIEVIPDYINMDRYQTINSKSHATLNIGWKGSVSRLSVLQKSGVTEAINKLFEEYPEVRLMLCTDVPPDLKNLGLPEESVDICPWCDREKWPEPLALMDIGILPLGGDYDQRAGWRSALEFMVNKIPWVGSQGPAYHELRPYGWLVDNTAESWHRILKDMVIHYHDYRAEALQTAYLFGLSQSVDENIHHVITIYAKITNSLLNGTFQVSGV